MSFTEHVHAFLDGVAERYRLLLEEDGLASGVMHVAHELDSIEASFKLFEDGPVPWRGPRFTRADVYAFLAEVFDAWVLHFREEIDGEDWERGRDAYRRHNLAYSGPMWHLELASMLTGFVRRTIELLVLLEGQRHTLTGAVFNPDVLTAALVELFENWAAEARILEEDTRK